MGLLNMPCMPQHIDLLAHACAVVGHSLGGAQAGIFAACANNGSKPFGLSSKTPLPNNEARDRCFHGNRFYAEDTLDYDPIAALAQVVGFKHPRVAAVRLSRPWLTDYGCSWM